MVIETPIEADDLTDGELSGGELLPVGSSFDPERDTVPEYQYAWGITADAEGNPVHGEPALDGAEKELIVPVDDPGPNEVLLYMLTSEVNFNDVWAITGIPVSTFRQHERSWHVTGSGGLGLVVAMGDGVQSHGKVNTGDLVNVYAGQFDVYSPFTGLDPMFADFVIQGYQTPNGSHQQFMPAHATQLFEPPSTVGLREAGSYTLTMGTVYRALFNTLDVRPGDRLFVEGSSTGTGRDAVVMAATRGLEITGLVSSEERAERAERNGADSTIDRTDETFSGAFTKVPRDEADWMDWKRAGDSFLDAFRRENGGELADHVVSHAGEQAFARSYQLLADGGRLTFYGASTGYELTFLGKEGRSAPTAMFDRAGLRAGQGVVVWYGTGDDVDGIDDEVGERAVRESIEEAARVVVVAETDEQLAHVRDGYPIEGGVSLESLADDGFERVDRLPDLPPPAEPDALAEVVGEYSNKMFKPLGKAIGEHLSTRANPYGNPDVIFERAGQDTLGVSTMLCSPHQGTVVYAEDMADRRYSFYAPQVWMRQRRILMPTSSILGTHMKNNYEVLLLNTEIDEGAFSPPSTDLVDWADTPGVHQRMWDNEMGAGSAVINHALPTDRLEDKAALFEAWGIR